MSRKPLSTDFLRPEESIFLPDTNVHLSHKANLTFAAAGIMVANVSPDFRDCYASVAGQEVGERLLKVGTMKRQMPDTWLAAFHYWAGVNLGQMLSAIALQRAGEKGKLLTNGKLNGCVLREIPGYAATFRWHDPARPFEEQTAQYRHLGWSFHVVRTNSRCWCPQGGKILYV